jgi:hypothetical protein
MLQVYAIVFYGTDSVSLLYSRCFDLLGFDHYTEEHADGLQMLRYNASTSYASHLDYFEGGEQLDHDYDSAHKGGNRFATVLLYMTDMEAGSGGETVFVSAWPQDQSVKDRVNLNLVGTMDVVVARVSPARN